MSLCTEAHKHAGERLGTAALIGGFDDMQKWSPTSEWSPAPTRLETFVQSASWQSLPFIIKVSLARLWVSEQPVGSASSPLRSTADLVPPAGSPR
jgi:hypothetical protein